MHTRLSTVAMATSLAIAPAASMAQYLGNFDTINDTGREAHGFEIELEGLSLGDISDTFGGAGRGFPTTVERYGAPTVSSTGTGVVIRYAATYDVSLGRWVAPGGTFSGQGVSIGTPTAVTFQTPGDNCWSGGGIGYATTTPCDHFGVGTRKNPSKTTYRWLVEDTPGSTTLVAAVQNLPSPTVTVLPPVQPANPPVVRMVIEAPPLPPPEAEPQFGTAIWAKVFTTEVDAPLELEGLMHDNLFDNHGLKLDKRPDGTEIEWQLLQKDPGNPDSGILDLGGEAGANAKGVIRRYEFYEFGGTYKAVDHEALFAPGFGDSNPNPGPNGFGHPGSDVGAFIGAQNAQINLAVPEPQAYAMLMLGLGVVGFAARRRATADDQAR